VVKIGVGQGLDVPRVQVAEVGKLPITTVPRGPMYSILPALLDWSATATSITVGSDLSSARTEDMERFSSLFLNRTAFGYQASDHDTSSCWLDAATGSAAEQRSFVQSWTIDTGSESIGDSAGSSLNISSIL
jgi:hypothetical protein